MLQPEKMKTTCSRADRSPMKLLLSCALVLMVPMVVSAQDARPLDHGYNMLAKGYELEQADNTAGAIEGYSTVHRSDSVYERVLLRHVAALLKLDRHADALPLAETGLSMDGEHQHRFLINKGIALFGLKRYDEAIATYDEGLRRFPGNFKIRHLRALTLKETGDPAGSLKALQETAVLFPTQQEVHLSLASVAQEEGATSQAALSLFMAMLVRWGDERSNQTLGYADEVLAGNMETHPKGVDLRQGDDFSEIDLLLANRVAMNKAYKVQPDLTYPFVRQGHLLLSQLRTMPKGTGFWSTYYVPLFTRLMDGGNFEGFVYHCLGSSTDAKVHAISVKKKSLVEDFRAKLFPWITEFRSTFPDSIGSAVQPVYHAWNEDNNLQGKGEGDINKNEHTGQWMFYHDNGAVSSHGSFDAEHKQTGTWTILYDNGKIHRIQDWSSGVQNGLHRSWYRNGAMKDSTFVKDGKAEGRYAEFANTGALLTRKTCVGGDITGPATVFHTCGTKEYDTQLKLDKANGPIQGLYADGKPSFSGEFKDNKRDGVVLDLYHNGRNESSISYVDGVRNGPYTDWYISGQKRSEGTYAKGHYVGKRTTWSINGNLSSEENYDEDGRVEGVRKDYTLEGVLETELEFRNGLLMRYRYLDRGGKVLSEGKRAKGRFQFVGYTPDGTKRMEGTYLDEGAKDGRWTWYYPDGTVKSEENLKSGVLDGTQRNFHLNGSLSTEFRYFPGKEETGPYTEKRMDGSLVTQGYMENGRVSGEQWQFHSNGKPMEHEYFVNGKLTGWQQYFDEQGILRSEERVEGGVLRELVQYDRTGKEFNRIRMGIGPFVLETKYESGAVAARTQYLNGVRHGTSTHFFPDGSKEFEAQYFNDEENGTWKTWHPNGKLRWERTYDMGKMTGTSRIHTLDGKLESEETYADGMSTGYKLYFPNGKVAIDRERRFDENHGPTRSYEPGGELQLVRYYSDGRMTGYSYNGPDGKLVDTIPLGEGVVKLRPKFTNGTPSREMDYRNNDIDGVYREFMANGKVLEESVYICGERNGRQTEYFADGKPASVSNWKNDEREGEQIEYWDNGQVMDRSNWTEGEMNGERTLYDRNGKAILVLQYRSGRVQEMRKQ
jgi:antitoxin component YwqK of YwqJK toxin-antitoxin module/tetratricopeptide (TPR) repeat protein